MEKQSDLFHIENPPDDPVDLFKKFLAEFVASTHASYVMMNLASRNDEFGVANRTVVFRGLKASDFCFVTERNSKKYAEINADSRVAVTFLLGFKTEDTSKNRQVRINGKAIELLENEITTMWEEESVHAKIRSHICVCGKPVNWDELKCKHDELLNKYESGEVDLKQTPSYTAFRIVAETIDFYEASANTIADRIVYRRCGETWTKEHVCA